MSGPDDYADPTTHQQVWELLTWYVNGSASPAQRRVVDAHLPHCDACREEHETQRRLHALMSRESATPDPAPGLARLLADIDAAPTAHAAPVSQPSVAGASGRGWKFAVAALATLAVLETATLATLGWQRADYVTLSSAPSGPARAAIRMVPAPTMSVGELHGHLRRLGLEIVGGPSEAGVYSLAPTGEADTSGALAALRATPGVLFAEPGGAPK